MPQYYDTASQILGVIENKILGPADQLLKRSAETVGVGNTFYRTNVAILQAPEGEPGGNTLPDPFFEGEGPTRTTCVGCGGCMMGCRYGAKNTLDLNYLYLAEKRGTLVFPETKVVDVKPLNGIADGAGGYEVHTVRSTGWFKGEPRRITCRGVVFSASSLGTMDLLFDLKEQGSLPNSAIDSASTSAPIPSRCWRSGYHAVVRICRKVSRLAPAFTSTNTHTSKQFVTRVDPTRWACSPRC
jgi:cholesterol oxidase